MALTPRQSVLLGVLVDLYTQAREPIHYSLVAKRLGIRNSTVYEMLKLLERRGYVTSQYVLSEDAGPGRSSLVFLPTAQFYATCRRRDDDAESRKEWESVKEQMLSRLGRGEVVEQALLEEIVSRLTEAEQPLVYCAHVLTALLLNMGREARRRLQQHEVIRQLLKPGPNAHTRLGLLPGFALGFSSSDPAAHFSDKLIPFTEICQTRLHGLDDANLLALAEFLRQTLSVLRDTT